MSTCNDGNRLHRCLGFGERIHQSGPECPTIWDYLIEDYDKGTVFITDDPFGSQHPLIGGLTEIGARYICAELERTFRAAIERVDKAEQALTELVE